MSRYFFALWPDQAVRNKISACQTALEIPGKLIPNKNLHITLLFMGRLNVNQLAQIVDCGEQIKLKAFTILLDQSGYFNKARINWLGLEKVPETLFLLQQALLRCATNIPIQVQQRDFVPHLTLARKSRAINDQTFAPVKWKINRFVLIESTDSPNGVNYQIIKQFPLKGS